MGDEVGLGLADAISMVRAQLAQAVEDGKGSPVEFEAGPLEVELSVAFTKQGGGDGGVRLGVVSFGAKGSASATDTHRVKFTFTPVNDAGGNLKLGDVGRG
jgi:hypothetical protein